jgi:hypothetical protein
VIDFGRRPRHRSCLANVAGTCSSGSLVPNIAPEPQSRNPCLAQRAAYPSPELNHFPSSLYCATNPSLSLERCLGGLIDRKTTSFTFNARLTRRYSMVNEDQRTRGSTCKHQRVAVENSPALKALCIRTTIIKPLPAGPAHCQFSSPLPCLVFPSLVPTNKKDLSLPADQICLSPVLVSRRSRHHTNSQETRNVLSVCR